MRFICQDIDPQAKITDLFSQQTLASPSITENGNTLLYAQTSWVKEQNQVTFYGQKYLKNLLNVKQVDFAPKTISSFASWIGLSIITNLNSTMAANSYIFNVNKALKLKTKMWFTIITDSGIIFTLPQRISTSSCISSFTVKGTYFNNWDNFVIEGESSGDYVIDIPNDDTIILPTLDSNAKTQIANCENSRNDLIYISINKTVSPLDYVIYNGNNYIIMSQKRDKDQMLYVAVREIASTYNFSGSNILTLMPCDNYSLNEVKTNKIWIDGRLIYRKVINFGALPNATAKTVPHNINFGTNTRIIYINGYGYDGSTMKPIPYVSISSSFGVGIYVTKTNIQINTGVDYSGTTECYITLEYVY